MDLKNGYPFWLIKSGLIYDYPKLAENKRTEVVIIGGGISGALTAYKLAQQGIHSIVVDARTIALGSTCASTSLLQYEIDVPLTELQHKVGLHNAVRAYQLCKTAIHELNDVSTSINFSDFRKRKSLFFAAHNKDVQFLKDEYALRKNHRFDVDILDSQQIKKDFFFSAPGALLTHTAAETNAYMFTHTLLQNCIKKGVEVFDRTKIINIKHRKKSIVCTTGDGYKINARKVVYAVGYEIIKYIEKPIVKLLSTYATISEHVHVDKTLWNKNVVMWNTQHPYLYMRSTIDNRILIGGRDDGFFDPSKRDKQTKRKTKLLSKDFTKLFPSVPFAAEFSWSGTFGSTKDGLPFIGRYNKFPNSYFALGFGGNGITFSQIAANIICDDILGKRNKDVEIFSFNR